MSDKRLRELERQAAASGDPEAEDRLARERQRHGVGRHADKVGGWVVIETVQCHWLGQLLGVQELGGGSALARLHPCWWLSNTEVLYPEAAGGQPHRVHTTTEHPADVYLTAAVLVSIPPADWDLSRLP